MSMDSAGRRATQIAKWGVDVAIALVIVVTGFFFWMVARTFYAVASIRTSLPSASRSTVHWPAVHWPVAQMVLALVLIVLLLIGLFSLRAFLRDVLAGRVFTPVNTRRLYRIAWLMIGYAAANQLFVLATSRAVPVVLLGLLHPVLLGGLLMLVLASAWRYGSELQRDRDLTV